MKFPTKFPSLCLFIIVLASIDATVIQPDFGYNNIRDPLLIKNDTMSLLDVQLSKFDDKAYTAILPSYLNNYIGITVQTNCVPKEVNCGTAYIGLFSSEDREQDVVISDKRDVVFDDVEKLFLVYKIKEEGKPLIIKYRKTNLNPKYEGSVTFRLFPLSRNRNPDGSIVVEVKPSNEDTKTLYAPCSKDFENVFFKSVDYVFKFEKCVESGDPTGGPNPTESSNGALIGVIVGVLFVVVIIGVVMIVIFVKMRKAKTPGKDAEKSPDKKNEEAHRMLNNENQLHADAIENDNGKQEKC